MNGDKKCCNFFPHAYLESPNLTFWGMGSSCLLEGYCGTSWAVTMAKLPFSNMFYYSSSYTLKLFSFLTKQGKYDRNLYTFMGCTLLLFINFEPELVKWLKKNSNYSCFVDLLHLTYYLDKGDKWFQVSSFGLYIIFCFLIVKCDRFYLWKQN